MPDVASLLAAKWLGASRSAGVRRGKGVYHSKSGLGDKAGGICDGVGQLPSSRPLTQKSALCLREFDKTSSAGRKQWMKATNICLNDYRPIRVSGHLGKEGLECPA